MGEVVKRKRGRPKGGTKQKPVGRRGPANDADTVASLHKLATTPGWRNEAVETVVATLREMRRQLQAGTVPPLLLRSWSTGLMEQLTLDERMPKLPGPHVADTSPVSAPALPEGEPDR